MSRKPSARDAVPVLRRSSGGGTVLLGTGCLLFSLVLKYERAAELREIRSSYAFILGEIIRILHDAIPEVEAVGISDLAVRGLKCSGNAQQRKRHYLLHHGTLLYAFPLQRVEEYLHLPERQPEYRQGRDHEAFLCNLPVSRADLIAQLRNVWKVERSRGILSRRSGTPTGRGEIHFTRLDSPALRAVRKLAARRRFLPAA